VATKSSRLQFSATRTSSTVPVLMLPAISSQIPDPLNPKCSEDSAYPAAPDSEYGWEKLFSERLYLSHMQNHGTAVRIARFHNIFGPEGTWNGGKEKTPVVLCRKVAEVDDGGPVNIGSEEIATINQLAEIITKIAGEKLTIKHISGPLGVRGRSSDNRLIAEKLGWKPSRPLERRLETTYRWIQEQVSVSRSPQFATASAWADRPE
jgi:GDP-D-mannose 3', 5'-epimerase